MILPDTNVLSLMFRRSQPHPDVTALQHRMLWLALHQRISIPCIVVQEVLSGVRHTEQFSRIEAALRKLPLLNSTPEDHIRAAHLTNRCAAQGIAVHVTDALLAAMALQQDGYVLTEDRDFLYMAPWCGVRVLSIAQALSLTA